MKLPTYLLPLCYRKEDHPYMSFLTEQWKNLLKSRFYVLILEVNISPLPSELCLLQLTSLTKRFPNDPAPNSSWEAPSIYFPFSVCPPGLWAPFRFPHPISWEASPAGPALTCPQTAIPHQAAGIAKCSVTKQALPNTTDAEVAKEVGGRK